MKIILTVFTVIITISIALAQDNFENFTREKKSIDLQTGICMSYIDVGNRNGTPVLLLHGYTDTSRSFQLLIEDLQRMNGNIRIIAPDLRGHGDSSMPDLDQCQDAPENCFRMQQFSDDIIDLLDRLGIQKAHIVGHSMGSLIAQTMALHHEDRVNSMVLMGTFVNGTECTSIHDLMIGDMVEDNLKCALEQQRPDMDWPRDAYSVLPLNLGERVTTYLRENWVAEAGAAKELLEAILPETLKIPLGTWVGAVKALGEIDYSAALQKIRIPTLILWGDQDIIVSADQEQVKTTFRSAAATTGIKVIYKTYGKLPLYKGGDRPGHNFHWAAHEEVAADINSFIKDGKPAESHSNGKAILAKDGSHVVKLN